MPAVASGKSSAETDAPCLATGKIDWFGKYKSTYPEFPRTSCVTGHTCTICFLGTSQLTCNFAAWQGKSCRPC